MTDLSAEDSKLVTLARATRARTGAAQGAAVRDQDGRTYAAATVSLPSLSVSAVGVCVAMAVASGSTGLQAVVVLGDGAGHGAGHGAGEAGIAGADLAVVRDFSGTGVTVHVADARGTVLRTLTS
jgi:hypothetical protein